MPPWLQTRSFGAANRDSWRETRKTRLSRGSSWPEECAKAAQAARARRTAGGEAARHLQSRKWRCSLRSPAQAQQSRLARIPGCAAGRGIQSEDRSSSYASQVTSLPFAPGAGVGAQDCHKQAQRYNAQNGFMFRIFPALRAVIRLERKPQAGFAALVAAPILKRQRSTMCLRNLSASRQADASAARLGSKEGDKYVGRVLNPRPVVHDPDFQLRILPRPSHAG